MELEVVVMVCMAQVCLMNSVSFLSADELVEIYL